MNHDTPGYDRRGNSYSRRRRRVWLLSPEAGFGGNGRTVPCFHCKKPVGKHMEVDRFPVCGHDGGTYARDNIVPACRRCNRTRCVRCAGVAGRDRREA